MNCRSRPPHLPKPPRDPVAYKQLHRVGWWLRTGGNDRSRSRKVVGDSNLSVSAESTPSKTSGQTLDRAPTTVPASRESPSRPVGESPQPTNSNERLDSEPSFILFEPTAWREIRIPPNSTATQVYRMLPTAADYEYGGYLTKTRIRYAAGEATRADVPFEKSCTFHTHPSDHSAADAPSARDVYHFLKWEHQRTITVGADWIWVWTKNQKTLTHVRRLWEWELDNMVPTLQRISDTPGAHLFEDYACEVLLRRFGLRWLPNRERTPQRWSILLRDVFGLRTVLIRR